MGDTLQKLLDNLKGLLISFAAIVGILWGAWTWLDARYVQAGTLDQYNKQSEQRFSQVELSVLKSNRLILKRELEDWKSLPKPTSNEQKRIREIEEELNDVNTRIKQLQERK